MKKLLLVSCSAFVGFVLAVALLGLPLTVRAGGDFQCASQSGDVNADGKLDLTDAVTILGHLFLGSPTELLPLCATQAPPILPDSGQTKCYGFLEGRGWVPVPCDSATCAGQDGLHAAGCPPEGRFADNGDGTVSDICTGLMWQKKAADLNGDGKSTELDVLAWCEALGYCENLSFAGHDDWRLPNVRELQNLVDYGRTRSPAIDPVFGVMAGLGDHWSSTTAAAFPGFAWSADLFFGYVNGIDKGFSSHVRAVRNAP